MKPGPGSGRDLREVAARAETEPGGRRVTRACQGQREIVGASGRPPRTGAPQGWAGEGQGRGCCKRPRHRRASGAGAPRAEEGPRRVRVRSAGARGAGGRQGAAEGRGPGAEAARRALPGAPRPPALGPPLKADAAPTPAEARLVLGSWVPDTDLTERANAPSPLARARVSTDIVVAFLTKSVETPKLTVLNTGPVFRSVGWWIGAAVQGGEGAVLRLQPFGEVCGP